MKEILTEEAKRKVPAITLPESEAINYASVLAGHPHREHLAAIFGAMDFTILPHKIETEDKPHASSLLSRNKFFHKLMALGRLTSVGGIRCTIATKNPECRTLGCLFLQFLGGRWREGTRQKNMD